MKIRAAHRCSIHLIFSTRSTISFSLISWICRGNSRGYEQWSVVNLVGAIWLFTVLGIGHGYPKLIEPPARWHVFKHLGDFVLISESSLVILFGDGPEFHKQRIAVRKGTLPPMDLLKERRVAHSRVERSA